MSGVAGIRPGSSEIRTDPGQRRTAAALQADPQGARVIVSSVSSPAVMVAVACPIRAG
jgi:hypothetical protein